MKVFWKYFLIVILLLIGLCALSILYLFFVPGSSLFGITYISYSDNFNSEAYDATNITTIRVNSRAYDVSILPASSEEISLRVYANSLGFVLNRNSDVNIDEKIEGDELIFDIDEPYGAAVINDSRIQLRIPTSKAFNIILNNTSSLTTINNENLQLNNLIYETDRGNLSFSRGTLLGYIDASIGRADFVIGKNAVINNNNVYLSATSGYFEALSTTLGDVIVESNKNAVIRINSCNNFDEDQAEAGGRIQIDTVAQVNITAADTNVYINNLTDGGTIRLTKSGRIEITNVLAETDLFTNTGNITITESKGPISLTSEDGNIQVTSAYLRVQTNTDYGDVDITFSEEAESYNDNPNSRMLMATTNNGKISATGVENIYITIQDNGRAEISMQDVYGENVIDGKRGSISMIINRYSEYRLHTKTDSGDVSVNLMQIAGTGTGGYTDKERTEYVNCTITSFNATLEVSTTTGSLYIRDEELIEY